MRDQHAIEHLLAVFQQAARQQLTRHMRIKRRNLSNWRACEISHMSVSELEILPNRGHCSNDERGGSPALTCLKLFLTGVAKYVLDASCTLKKQLYLYLTW